jgi:hypothetical protein
MSEMLKSELHREAIRIKLHRPSQEKLHDDSSFDCEVWGDGIKRVKLGGDAEFLVRSPTPDLLYFSIDVFDPEHNEMDVGFRCMKENTHLVSFCPPKEGDYVVDVKWDGKPIMGSPFTVCVKE